MPKHPGHAVQALPDIIARDLAVLFCGINPGMSAALAGHHFAARSNRFWRILYLAGFTPRQILPEDDRTLLRYDCGLTTVVERPTIRASELGRDEFAAASARFVQKIHLHAPRNVAFLGKAAFCAISGQRSVPWGAQPVPFAGVKAWVLPNPSGLNRAFRLDDLVRAYRELRWAAEL